MYFIICLDVLIQKTLSEEVTCNITKLTGRVSHYRSGCCLVILSHCASRLVFKCLIALVPVLGVVLAAGTYIIV